MGKFTALSILLLVASYQISLEKVVCQNVPEPPPNPGYQCYNDCLTDQQEDCNPGCWCQPVYSGTTEGVCLWDGNPPPASCLSHSDCAANEDGTSHCFKPNGSAHGLCISKGIHS